MKAQYITAHKNMRQDTPTSTPSFKTMPVAYFLFSDVHKQSAASHLAKARNSPVSREDASRFSQFY